jgi:hypothetical protein
MKMFYADRITVAADRWPTQSLSVSGSLRDHLFDALFAAGRSDRNRACVLCLDGAMASELLVVTVDQVDPREQRIGVHRKVRDGCNGYRPRRRVVAAPRTTRASARQGRPYATSCQHKFACNRCLKLRPDAAKRIIASLGGRLVGP